MAQSDWNIFEPLQVWISQWWAKLLESTQVNELRMTIFCCGNIKSKTKKNICGYVDLSVHHHPIFTARPGGRPPLPGEEVGSCHNNNLQQRFVNERGVSFPTKHVSCHDVLAPPLCTHKFGLNRWIFATRHIFQGRCPRQKESDRKTDCSGLNPEPLGAFPGI